MTPPLSFRRPPRSVIIINATGSRARTINDFMDRIPFYEWNFVSIDTYSVRYGSVRFSLVYLLSTVVTIFIIAFLWNISRWRISIKTFTMREQVNVSEASEEQSYGGGISRNFYDYLLVAWPHT